MTINISMVSIVRATNSRTTLALNCHAKGNHLLHAMIIINLLGTGAVPSSNDTAMDNRGSLHLRGQGLKEEGR